MDNNMDNNNNNDTNDNNDNISEISDNDKLSVDLNFGNYDSDETLILEDSDNGSGFNQFWLNDDESLQSRNSDSDSDSVLNEFFEINEELDPIYNDF